MKTNLTEGELVSLRTTALEMAFAINNRIENFNTTKNILDDAEIILNWLLVGGR